MIKLLNALVTPLDTNGRGDVKSLNRLLSYGLNVGIDGFFLFGNMGEGLYLQARDKYKLARAACERINQSADLVIGVNALDESGIYRNIEEFSDLNNGYFAAMLPGKDKIKDSAVDMLHRIADFCDRPFFLYYIPQANGVIFNSREFKEIFSHPNIIGLKNSSGTISLRKELIFLKQEIDFLLYEGCEWGIDEALSLGCDGIIVGLGTLGGTLFRKLIDAFTNDKLQQAHKYQMDLLRVFHMVYGENNSCSIIGQKYALYKLGLLSTFKTLHPRQQNLPLANRRQIEQCLLNFQNIWNLDKGKSKTSKEVEQYVEAS